MADRIIPVRSFPFCVGRSAECGLRSEEAGLWDRHFELKFDPHQGFLLHPVGEALVTINQESASGPIRLRNGDTIAAGALQMRFWLGETGLRSLVWRERLTWILLALLTLGQVAFIYRLVR
jgi:hypothetical protein